MTDNQKEQIRKLYPDHITREISEMIGLAVNTINGYARKEGLEHSEDTWKRIRENRIRACLDGQTDESHRKSGERYKEKYRMEMFRLLSGMKRETRITISGLSLACRRRMSALCYKNNYFKDKDLTKAVLYYDKETRRNLESEKYANETYGIKFISVL